MNKSVYFFLFVNLVIQTFATSNSEIDYQFHKFTLTHDKHYSSMKEFEKRRSIFIDNYLTIKQHNAYLDNNYTLGINQFSDLTSSEFRDFVENGKLIVSDYYDYHPYITKYSHLNSVPDSIDWRQKNAVSEVKNQQQCGSCWAFSTTGSIEGVVAIATGDLYSLSEQQLVDCDKTDSGCNGGFMTNAYQYVMKAGGLETEKNYPYEARDDTCRFDKSKVVAKISSFANVPTNNDAEMVKRLAEQPVSIAIYAAGNTFQHYSGGIYDDPACYTDQSHLDHGVLLVGYGTTDDGKDYYILKNSWGTTWGEDGYMRIARGSNKNICGLLDVPCYPIY